MQKHKVVGLLLWAALLLTGCASGAGTVATVSVVEPQAVDETTPEFRDIFISDVVCNGARRAMYFNGIPEMPVKNVSIRNCCVSSTTGIEMNYAEDVTLENVSVTVEKGKELVQSNVRNLIVK